MPRSGPAAGEGRLERLLPFTGQSAAPVHDVAPAAALIGRIMTEAEDALGSASNWVRG